MAAFSVIFFHRSTTATRIVVGVVLAGAATLVMWCLVNFWETEGDREEVRVAQPTVTKSTAQWWAQIASRAANYPWVIAGLRYARKSQAAGPDRIPMHEERGRPSTPGTGAL